ncbi:methylmalonic aciduria and homocystinuria type D homolog, mitochondrial isoform X1 [Cimex lectularius]|uniref:Methylmalonic aciduria and homocystinuria type D homolog, mitochondrial n=2 Tax=Cimex lectularius TaxID=79782 RepID=A0A8I6RIG2_CIMLE|nr:methylmalonic aciduria and homocystinuria type D homolog, mitochondrial isoform X1 [Cimex lectularius]
MQMLFPKLILKFRGSNKWAEAVQKSNYSRKSSSNFRGTYKIVTKASDPAEDVAKQQLATHTNWELLAPQGFRFYLPGSVGPAWHDEISASFIPSTLTGIDAAELECDVQECPVLLRQGISELFPGTDTSACQLTVVSLSQKKHKKITEHDIEQLTKQFMWAAQDICHKLKMAGYWADFINPFSGVPFGTPHNSAHLYKTDERFRCIGFQIKEKGSCKIITNKASNKFIGSLFTTAPPSTTLLKEILREYEY